MVEGSGCRRQFHEDKSHTGLKRTTSCCVIPQITRTLTLQPYMRQGFVASILLMLVCCQASSDPTAGRTSGGPTQGNGNSATCKPTPAMRPGTKKILFVGNSLTYFNDLPSRVADIGASKGNLVEQEMMAYPNYAIQDHWNEGCLQSMISSGYYDFIVVQQGPSSQADGAQSLLDYGELIQQLCKQHDTKLAFFMVWPARVNYHTFNGVISNYTSAAYATGAILCPVGYAWKRYIDDTGDWSYYGPDDFHPSAVGTGVAAEIIYNSLFP
jgi:hypothetical protein